MYANERGRGAVRSTTIERRAIGNYSASFGNEVEANQGSRRRSRLYVQNWRHQARNRRIWWNQISSVGYKMNDKGENATIWKTKRHCVVDKWGWKTKQHCALDKWDRIANQRFGYDYCKYNSNGPNAKRQQQRHNFATSRLRCDNAPFTRLSTWTDRYAF